MAISNFLPPALIEYSNPPSNLIGACIFLYYIAVALFLSTHVVQSVRTRYERFPQTVNRRSTKVLILFTVVSFVSLARHMINFLLHSYLAWRTNQILFKPEDVHEDDVVGPWKWMLNSSLFESFARELTSSGPNSVVTQLSLLVTWFWNVRLAQEGMITLLSRFKSSLESCDIEFLMSGAGSRY